MDRQTILDHFQGDYLPFFSRFLPGLKPGNGAETMALCCFREEKTPSLSVNMHTGQYYCFGCGAKGDLFTMYAWANGLTLPGDFPKVLTGMAQDFGINGTKPTLKQTVTARYDYQDESGNLLYQIERLEPGKNGKKKDFLIRRPDGKGGWIWKKDDVQIIPYQLPEILKADLVLIPEGEKDCEALAALGFTATTNPFGAGKWPDHFGPYFAGKNVVLIPDNDDGGRNHMHQVATNLKGHAAAIKWLDFPDLPEGGDVSDWLERYPDQAEAKEQLAACVEAAPVYREQAPNRRNQGRRRASP